MDAVDAPATDESSSEEYDHPGEAATKASVEPRTPEASEPDFSAYSRGRVLRWLFRLDEVYLRHFAEYRDELREFDKAAAELAPDDRQVAEYGRDSILLIGGYQVWDAVARGPIALSRSIRFALVMTAVGSGVATIVYLRNNPWPEATLYLLLAAATALATLALAYRVTRAPIPSSPRTRSWLGLVGLLGMIGASWLLFQWQTVWGEGLFAGLALAITILFLVGLCVRITHLAMAAVYRYTWSRFPADEITETLAATCLALRDGDDLLTTLSNRAQAASWLDHVADCAERYLPGYLAQPDSFHAAVQPRFGEMAAAIRVMAQDCLFAKAADRDHLRQEVIRMMVAGVQGHWGDWKSAPLDDAVSVARWRRWLAGARGVLMAVAPAAIIAGGALYLYRTDDTSALLDAEVLGPLLVAAFGFFTTFLTGWIDPRSGTRSGVDDKRSRSR